MIPAQRPVFDYQRPLRADEAAVLVACADSEADFGAVMDLVLAAGAKYGYSVAGQIGGLRGLTPVGDHAIQHLIWLTPIDGLSSHDAALGAFGDVLDRFTSVSIALRYPPGSNLAMAESLVGATREIFGDRVNFIFPDVVGPSGLSISPRKIVENATCDTVRIKYVPQRLCTESPQLPPEIARFFRSVSKAIGSLRLFHRWPTDGYISHRLNKYSNDFYVTATKTDKVRLDLMRVVLVHEYDVSSNKVRFSGPFLPSSDSVEAAMVFAECQDVVALVHTHASTRFTRNRAFRHRVTTMGGAYGEASIGHTLTSAVKAAPDGFVIMEDHGEVFALREPTGDGFDFAKRVRALERLKL